MFNDFSVAGEIQRRNADDNEDDELSLKPEYVPVVVTMKPRSK